MESCEHRRRACFFWGNVIGNVEVPNQALGDERSVPASVAIEPLRLGNHLLPLFLPLPRARVRGIQI